MCEFKVGEAVMVRNNVAGTPDVKAVIKKRLGPLMYEIETDTAWSYMEKTCRSFEKPRNCSQRCPTRD